MTTVLDLKLDEVHPSKLNHRKTFPEKALAELAASMKAPGPDGNPRGVLQPITVRTNNKGWEIIFGERRWRAAKIAGLPSIPAIERAMGDAEVLEAQLVENVQRADVHPMEEAECYRELIDKHKNTVEQLVAKTGKSRSAIYARLELCKLAPAPRKAFLEDTLNASLALMIARIPDAKLQTQATKEVLGDGAYDDYEGVSGRRELVDDDDSGKRAAERLPLSVREAQVHLQRKYMLRLATAPFDITDAKLVAAAGACTSCSYRTGNQPELFADVKSPDVCTKPACFESKKKADWDGKAAAAVRAGMRVLNDKEAKNVFEGWGDRTEVSINAAYVDPEAKLPYELDATGKKTWKSLLGKETPAQAIALDGAGAARTLWDRKSAIATATKTGKLKEAKAEAKARTSSAAAGNNSYRDQQRKREQEAKKRKRIAELALGKIAEGAQKDAGTGPSFWLPLVACLLRLIDNEGARMVCRRRGEDPGGLGTGKDTKALLAIASKATGPELRGLAVELVAADQAAGGTWNTAFGKNLTALCSVFGVDTKKLAAQVATEDKAKKATPAKPAKKGGRK